MGVKEPLKSVRSCGWQGHDANLWRQIDPQGFGLCGFAKCCSAVCYLAVCWLGRDSFEP